MRYFLLSIVIFTFVNFPHLVFGEKFIVIQPFAGIKKVYVDHVFWELKKIYPKVKVIPEIKLKNSLQNQTGTRYRADLILKDLSVKHTDDIVVGLTSKDISTSYKGRSDWGVMGLSYLNGNACVISTFRLKGDNVDEKFFKLAIHEIGHAEGLKHCANKTCYMRDAKGKDHWNQLTDYCQSCKKYLHQRGWKFK